MRCNQQSTEFVSLLIMCYTVGTEGYMATKVTTLKNAEKTDNLLPRTELNAIFDSDGNYLDSNLKASDLNALKGGAVDELVRFTEDGAGTPIPTDADTLEGHDASYFATAESVSSLTVTTYTQLVDHTIAQGSSSWQSWSSDVFDDNHKKFLLYVTCTGATYNSIIFTKDELDTIRTAGVLATSAIWHTNTVIIANINSNSMRVSISAKTSSLPCRVMLYAMD